MRGGIISSLSLRIISMNIKQVLNNFVNGGRTCHAASVTNEGNGLRSYATYIAHRNQDGSIIVRNRKYSVTTSKQQTFLKQELRNSGYKESGTVTEYGDEWTVWKR